MSYSLIGLATGVLIYALSASGWLSKTQNTRVDSYHTGIAQVAPAVVSLYSSETVKTTIPALNKSGYSPVERLSTSQGSGVIIDQSGLVLTNYHLIKGADIINVVLSTGELHTAQLLGSDIETDLAVVKIDAGKPLPYTTFASSPSLRVGDIVLAIGNPFGVGQTVTQGIVSATARKVAGGSAWQNFVQIDAAINPGNSGGALINPNGQLVGINTAAFTRGQGAQGIGFAIAAEQLRHVVPQLIEQGRVTRGWLGIAADNLPMFPALNQKIMRGAVVTSVIPNSPAAAAKLRSFDVVTRFNGQDIANSTEFLLLVSALSPQQTVEMEFWRKGKRQKVSVTLAERPRAGGR